MTDKDPNFVDDRDQKYYNSLFGDDVEPNGDTYTEEYAAEAVDPDLISRRALDDDEVKSGAGTGMGWLALALSIIGLFFLPIVMGIAGIIIGFIARGQGARGLGAWSIGIGAAVIILRLVAYPFV